MAQMLAEEISTRTVGRSGRIAPSPEARRRLGLEPGTRWSEFVVDGCLVYVPEDTVMSISLGRLQRWLDEQGITAEDIEADLEAHKEEVFALVYPELAR